MIKQCFIATISCFVLTGVANAGDDLFEEMFAPYSQRTEGVTVSAGNAKAINSATHIVDPWPAYAKDRHIPANGERMVGAFERYRDVKKIMETPPTLEPDTISTSEVTGGGNSSGGGNSGNSDSSQ
jgi:hypothetical protein